jgi:hypothetical protein
MHKICRICTICTICTICIIFKICNPPPFICELLLRYATDMWKKYAKQYAPSVFYMHLYAKYEPPKNNMQKKIKNWKYVKYALNAGSYRSGKARCEISILAFLKICRICWICTIFKICSTVTAHALALSALKCGCGHIWSLCCCDSCSVFVWKCTTCRPLQEATSKHPLSSVHILCLQPVYRFPLQLSMTLQF